MAFGDFTVVRSTVKWVLNSSGVLASVAVNTPAFEFNTDGTYKGLLVEPAGTNLLLRSEEFDNAYWVKSGATVSADASASPDGTTTAEKLVESAVDELHYIRSAVFGGTSDKITVTVYAKAGERSRLTIAMWQGTTFARSANATFNLTNGTVVFNNTGQGSTWTNIESSIVQDVNGYYRCRLTANGDGQTYRVYLSVGNPLQNTPTNGTGTTEFEGDGTSGLFIWGAQLEESAVATSYMPTVASTANRGADSVTLTGASSLIGQTEGTLYVEASVANLSTVSFGRVFEVGTDVQNRISIMANLGDVRGFITTINVDTQGGTMSEAVADNTIFRAALGYKVGTNLGALYVNGTGDITSPTAIPTSNIVAINSRNTGEVVCVSHIRSVALFPTRLSNAQLESLTTL